ncbi:hypothetical protein DRP43_05290 [candidate division TA06 bacterium]|uniref:Uncharacterized protein n=1 Tax=candidate division TA06 bacterium TaxID=2250710 RepID=A0A660SDM3_UNCT6|nr:hypothetical protein [Candidatus Cloacimonadota bacterium]RKX68652.1 MAG: hypothetical protein DRP43_05290 [candidate division TA06 bacterium]
MYRETIKVEIIFVLVFQTLLNRYNYLYLGTYEQEFTNSRLVNSIIEDEHCYINNPGNYE